MQIGLVALYTHDQDAGIAFYRDRLGYEVIQDAGDENYRWVEVARPGAEVGVVLAMPTSDEERALIGKQGFIYFVDDVQAAYDDLTAKGVPFHTPPSTEFWGTYAQFKDHEGNDFLLSQRAGLHSP